MSNNGSENMSEISLCDKGYFRILLAEITELISFRERLNRLMALSQDSADQRELVSNYRALIADRVEVLHLKLTYMAYASPEEWEALGLNELDLRYYDRGQLTENAVGQLKDYAERSLSRFK